MPQMMPKEVPRVNQILMDDKNSHYGHFMPISKEGYSIAMGEQA
jgi:hypothetical protein